MVTGPMLMLIDGDTRSAEQMKHLHPPRRTAISIGCMKAEAIRGRAPQFHSVLLAELVKKSGSRLMVTRKLADEGNIDVRIRKTQTVDDGCLEPQLQYLGCDALGTKIVNEVRQR